MSTDGRRVEPGNDRPTEAPDAGYIRGLDEVASLDFLDELCQRWHLTAEYVDESFELQISNIFRTLDVDVEDNMLGSLETDKGSFGIQRLGERLQHAEVEAIALYHRLHELGLFPARASETDGAKHTALKKMLKVFEIVFYAKKITAASLQARLAVHQLHSEDGLLDLDKDLDARLGEWALRFRYIDGSLSPFQNFILYLLDAAMERRYRKFGDWLYEPIVTTEGYDTHAWRQKMEIKEFVYSMLTKETCFDQWKNATASQKNVSAAVEYLTNCHDYQLPNLVRQRGVYSFNNGIYVASRDEFIPYDSGIVIPQALTACKFIDDVFVPYDAWRDIPTPSLDTIPVYQDWPSEVVDWYYIFLGRMLYAIGDHDKWQVAPFFRGVGGTGKSTTLLKVMKLFFDPMDVGILSNNIENKFGLSAFYDKYVVLGPEVRNDLAIDQAEYQSIVSGEDVQINVKHKKALSVEWKPPLAFAGNEVPQWADSGGAIQRRTVVFEFMKMVQKGDMDLDVKLARELPAIIQKANKAYLDMAGRYARENVWTVLPQYFQNTRNSLAQTTNSIEGLLASPDVRFGPEEFCSLDDFKNALREYEISNKIKSKRYDRDTFAGPFDKFGLRIVRDTRTYNGSQRLRDFVVGMSFIKDDDASFML